MNLVVLPEDCFSHILSLTSPRDACCASLVSWAVRSLADSDIVWEHFLPSDYQEILPRLTSPLPYSSKKELFFRLCDPHLIDGGRKIFSLDKSTGKKRYVLSARELSIAWASNPLYWYWKAHSQSRFSEVAELRTICWLQLQGKFDAQKLSPNTNYKAYLLVKFAGRAYGLDTLPSEVSLRVGNFKSQSKVYLGRQGKMKNSSESYHLRSGSFIDGKKENPTCEREDKWVEIELGSFYNGGVGVEEVVEMSLEEVTGEHLKGGLIVDGIELRPVV